MKKWLPALLGVLLILLLCSYFILPGKVSIYHHLPARLSPRSLQRGLEDEGKWQQWWPGEVQEGKGSRQLSYNGYTYTLEERALTTLHFTVSKGGFSTRAALNFIPTHKDSVQLSWVVDQPLPSSPSRRLQAYRASRQLEEDLLAILQRMKDFYADPDNIYSIAIKKDLVVDSILVSTYATSNGFPSTEFVYGLVDQLQQYAAQQGARETGYPMLNVHTEDSVQFLTRVAIPVNKKLPPSGTIAYKWMLGGGNILICEVKGGPAAVRAALHQMDLYASDHQRVAPAIPFESLVTDRRKVKDTAQWVTRIYYPVM